MTVNIEPVDAQFRKIKKRFDEDPTGWRVLTDVDPRGNKDMFISQRDELWQIKSKPLSPVAGIARSCHVRNLDDEIQHEINIRGIEGDKYVFSMLVPQPERKEVLVASGVESFARSKSWKLKAMLQGKNGDVERELTEGVEKEFERSHPQRKQMFL